MAKKKEGEKPRYYSETVKQAVKKYKNTSDFQQVNISGRGVKDLFRAQAYKYGGPDMPVNRYVVDLVKDDSDGNLLRIPLVREEDVPAVMKVLSGEGIAFDDAEMALGKLDAATGEAFRTTASAGSMTANELMSLLMSAASSEFSFALAEVLLRCLEACGADRRLVEEVIAAHGKKGGTDDSQNV